ncbi:MAG: hypothetical protein ACLUEK_01745 [Oscillospiraceae bacterium]
MDFDKLNSVLLDAVLRRVGLNELYAGVSACIGLPLICFDTSFRLVAHAFNRPFYFNHWEYIAQHGGADEDAVLGNNYLVDQEKMYKNRKSLCFDSGNSSGYPQACGPVLMGDRLVAYCGIMIEDCDVEDALRANDLLAEATAVLLRETSLDVGQPELAEKLLIENELGGEAARKFASAFPPPYAFIMISVQDSACPRWNTYAAYSAPRASSASAAAARKSSFTCSNTALRAARISPSCRASQALTASPAASRTPSATLPRSPSAAPRPCSRSRSAPAGSAPSAEAMPR